MSPASRRSTVDLAPTTPFDGDGMRDWLRARAIPGVEEVAGTRYRRVLRTAGGPVVVELDLGADRAVAHLPTGLGRSVRTDAVAALRRLVDADAPVREIAAVLGADDALAPRVLADPGLRAPGTVDGAEQALRAVLGQQVSVAAARTLAGRFAATHGAPVEDPGGGLTHAFPDPAVLATLDPEENLSMPRARARAFVGLARAIADGDVDLAPGADVARSTADLLALPGIGPWTVAYVGLRTLRDLDAFPATDLGIRYGARALGLPEDPDALADHAERWRPWRGYAAHHLWAAAATPAPPSPRAT